MPYFSVMDIDSYKTLSKPSEEILYKDRKSKFFGYAFPITSDDEIKNHIESIKKKHPTANHVCYAWQLGHENPKYRANDDGEPNNSAGMPIYGQIQAFGATNILVAVARIFGGTKLGVGGLIQAYRETAKMTLESSELIVKTIDHSYEVSFTYAQLNKVMGIVKKNRATIKEQCLELDCKIIVDIPKKDAEKFLAAFEGFHTIIIKPIV